MTPTSDPPPAQADGLPDDAATVAAAVVVSASAFGALEPISAMAAPVLRKRPKPGERRVQILQVLAGMLELPGADRVTTAALAARLGVSEAALYRHFASKAQMFEGLIEFIEQTVATLIEQIRQGGHPPPAQVHRMLAALLQFGEKNPGMARVMVGDALVYEHERLLARMNQFFERFEAQLRQCLGNTAADGVVAPSIGANGAAGAETTTDADVHASVLTAFAVGRLQRYARSGFRRSPTEHLDAALRLLGG